eukprot:1152081-Pelagomonas_calceolata.AAC.8
MYVCICPCLQAATGRMQNVQLAYKQDAGLTVVVAANGYPGNYPKGSVIKGTDTVSGAKVRCNRYFKGSVIEGLVIKVKQLPFKGLAELGHQGTDTVPGAKPRASVHVPRVME